MLTHQIHQVVLAGNLSYYMELGKRKCLDIEVLGEGSKTNTASKRLSRLSRVENIADKIKPPARAFLVEKLWKKIVLLLILLSFAPPGAFPPVLAPGTFHPGLGMETFGSDAFVGNPVQVGDALLALIVSGWNLDPDHLGCLRLDQVDQIQ